LMFNLFFLGGNNTGFVKIFDLDKCSMKQVSVVCTCCSVLQCVAACCSVLQRVAVCCSVLQCVTNAP